MIVVAAYHIFVYVLFLVQGGTSLHQKQHTSQAFLQVTIQWLLVAGAGRYLPAPEIMPTQIYMICCHNTHNNGIFIILMHDFS